MENEKSAEAMWKQIFQIQKYDLVNWKLKWNITPSPRNKHYWKLNKTTAIKLLEAI